MKGLFYTALILCIGAWFAIAGHHEGEPKSTIMRELDRRDRTILILAIAASAGWMVAAAMVFGGGR